MRIEERLEELGLTLPPPVKPPPGVILPFSPVRAVGDRAVISGHGPQGDDGSIVGPFGKVGAELTIEDGYRAARLTALSILGSLRRELGDLDRIAAWVKVLGMVNSAPDFDRQPAWHPSRRSRSHRRLSARFFTHPSPEPRLRCSISRH